MARKSKAAAKAELLEQVASIIGQTANAALEVESAFPDTNVTALVEQGEIVVRIRGYSATELRFKL